MATKYTDGCFQHAEDDEELFTLLARDKTAPFLVILWTLLRVLTLKNRWGDPKLKDARGCAGRMRKWRREHRPHA